MTIIYKKKQELGLNLAEMTELFQLLELLTERTVVKLVNGKKLRVKIKRLAGRLSGKQKRALRKARRKANRGSAKRKRKKTLKIRKRVGVKSQSGGSRPKSLKSN